jgi:hypothetical protein
MDKLHIQLVIEKKAENKTTANTGFAKVSVHCSVDKFVVNQSLFHLFTSYCQFYNLILNINKQKNISYGDI